MISAGGDFLARLGAFKAILVDEVAQSTESAALVPIVTRGCERVVLAGDHCQLPPSVQSAEAEARGLSLSLFGRLIAQGVRAPLAARPRPRPHPQPTPTPTPSPTTDPNPHQVRPFFLDLQFRAHPKLAEFPADMIYGGRLRSGVTAQARPAPRGFAWPRLAVPLAFVETGGYRDGCAESAESESKSNAGEAARVIELLKVRVRVRVRVRVTLTLTLTP